MRQKNVELRQRILKIAKSEFIKKGFSDASLRNISRRTKTTLSNLYTYFKDKDDLFSEVLKVQVDDIKKLADWAEKYRPTSGPFDSYEQEVKYAHFVLDYIDKNREELDLLFNRSGGSQLEDFKEWIATRYEENWQLYFKDINSQFDNQFKVPSEFFIHNLCHFYLNTISEMLDHNLSRNEMHDIVHEVIRFTYIGTMSLIDPNNKTEWRHV